MNIEEFREYCISKKGVEETFPFDQSTLVFKVMGKMFALTGLDNPDFSVNLKCTPEYALELRAEYLSIIPGYHMSKVHWNTIEIYKNEVPDELIKDLIDLSYKLVIEKMPKKLQQTLLSEL